MNFAKGILESRMQTYRHLKPLLKTIPLETPTSIELSPSNEIQVTLFDANHCIGAVMFLIQGQGKAVLYTGDVRAESWWVNSLVQNPILPYSSGHKRLDTIYLDTTYANRSEVDQQFPSKAEGLRELLTKVSSYPPDTFFHFEAWTFGYEKAWTALSACLGSQIHLDRYRWRLYRSLLHLPQCSEAPPLVGFQLGNHRKHGCLTPTPDSRVRLDSCERGTSCPLIEDNPSVVRIIPIVKRLKDGTEIAEAGIGGGKGDLDQIHELETNDPMAIRQLMTLCASKLEDPETLSKVLQTLTAATDNNQSRIRLFSSQKIEVDHYDAFENMSLQQFVDMLAQLASDTAASSSAAATQTRKTQHVSAPAAAINTAAAAATADQGTLPRIITLPWARHASYSELCELMQAFRPRDIYPCTVDKVNWTPAVSMQALFGQFCSDDVFSHDAKMMAEWEERERGSRGKKRKPQDTQDAQDSDESFNERHTEDEASSSVACHDDSTLREHIQATGTIRSHSLEHVVTTPTEALTTSIAAQEQARVSGGAPSGQTTKSQDLLTASDPTLATPRPGAPMAARISRAEDDDEQEGASSPPPIIREWTGRAARNSQGMDWANFGGLICAGNEHTEEEEEL